MNRAEARRILERQNSICPICNEEIFPFEDFDIDHEWARGRGGPDSDDNLRAVHKHCHARKTARDITEIAKTKRIARKHSEHESRLETREKKPTAQERAIQKIEARRIKPETERAE